jgi:protein involved in polysaccharide export with SLBB domain
MAKYEDSGRIIFTMPYGRNPGRTSGKGLGCGAYRICSRVLGPLSGLVFFFLLVVLVPADGWTQSEPRADQQQQQRDQSISQQSPQTTECQPSQAGSEPLPSGQAAECPPPSQDQEVTSPDQATDSSYPSQGSRSQSAAPDNEPQPSRPAVSPAAREAEPSGRTTEPRAGQPAQQQVQQQRRAVQSATPAQPPAFPQPKRADNPYPDSPALRDLYRQYSIQSNKNIERFGASVFKNGSGNTDKLAMDIPVGPDYVLGPGDTVMLDVSGGAPQRLRSVVDPEGRVTLPGGGTLLVAGMTIQAAEQAIEQVMVRRYNDAKVDLSLTRLRTVRVYIVGDVERPGAYDISALSTAINGLLAAGGPTSRGSLRVVRHYRGEKLIATIDLYDLLLRGVRTDGQRLQSGDSILVPPAGIQVVIEGAVRRPAMYELRSEQTLAQVLDLAGGTLPEASLWQISIDRVEAHESHVTRTVPIPPGADETGVKTALAAYVVHDGDRVFVAPISPVTEQSVYLEGHVFRTGKYAFHPGMKVTDLVRSYSDLLPEPGSHAEIIRLDGPDLRPIAISFDLVAVLDGKAEALELKPFDVIRVYGRYTVDPPKVTIAGEVLRPGVYPLAAGMRVSDLIRLAGGFKRSAYREDALLASYQIQDGRSVQIEQKQVNLLQIAAGNSSGDALLKPGDQVSIRQMAGWRNIGAAITVAGEVQFPGSYGIEPGEHLSSVIRRAGGFLPEAYPRAAVFDRLQVKDLNEENRLTIIRKIETTPSPVKWSETSGTSGANPAIAFQEQKQEMLLALKRQPLTGRMVIHISPNLSEWENTPFDLELRGGDSLVIPKQPGFVIVTGQVSNSTALIYTPGKSVGTYLKQAGGPTSSADTKKIYVIQASGRVIGNDGAGLFRSIQDVLVSPGDTIVVPDKIMVESQTWKNVLSTAQFITSLAIAAAAVASF